MGTARAVQRAPSILFDLSSYGAFCAEQRH
jgi:hypothetical protein